MMLLSSGDFGVVLIYAEPMKKRPLIETNPYLKNPVEREEALIHSICTSSAIEGVFCKGMGKDRVLGKKSGIKKKSPVAGAALSSTK